MLGFIAAMFVMCMGDPLLFEDGDVKIVLGKVIAIILLTIFFNTVLF